MARAASRQPADRPARTGGRQGPPRRADGADTDPGRPGPGRAACGRGGHGAAAGRAARPAAEPAPPAPAPYLPAAPEPVQARADDDPLTSPHFARARAAADDSRSYRTPGATPARGRTVRRPGLPEARRTATPAPGRPGGYPARRLPGLRRLPGQPGGRHRPGHQPRRASPQQRGRPRPGQLRRPGPRQLTDPSGGYESYPGTPDGGRGYPASSGRHGYPARQADRTDPGASRPDLGAPRTDPGAPRTDRAPGPPGPAAQSTARPARPRRQAPQPAPSHAASAAIRPAPLPRPRAGAVTGRRRRGALGPGGPGQPVRQLRGHDPAGRGARPGSGRRARRRPRPPASPYPPGQQPAGGNSYPGYTTGPTAAYSDPYGPGHGTSRAWRLPGQRPAAGRRRPAEQGTTWYSAPPAAAPQAPAGAYPYQDPAYPPRRTTRARVAIPRTPGTRDDTRYRSGQTEDPYRPDGYSGYHSRQG